MRIVLKLVKNIKKPNIVDIFNWRKTIEKINACVLVKLNKSKKNKEMIIYFFSKIEFDLQHTEITGKYLTMLTRKNDFFWIAAVWCKQWNKVEVKKI